MVCYKDNKHRYSVWILDWIVVRETIELDIRRDEEGKSCVRIHKCVYSQSEPRQLKLFRSYKGCSGCIMDLIWRESPYATLWDWNRNCEELGATPDRCRTPLSLISKGISKYNLLFALTNQCLCVRLIFYSIAFGTLCPIVWNLHGRISFQSVCKFNFANEIHSYKIIVDFLVVRD